MGYQEMLQKKLGADRQIVTEIDLFRASTFTQVILSGANNYTSGQTVLNVTASSIVIMRPLNIHFQNRETAMMTVVFRDGSITGGIVAGPYVVNGQQDRTIEYAKLMGRRFLSGIYAVVLSGAFSQGIVLNIGYVLEPNPNAQGGYLE